MPNLVLNQAANNHYLTTSPPPVNGGIDGQRWHRRSTVAVNGGEPSLTGGQPPPDNWSTTAEPPVNHQSTVVDLQSTAGSGPGTDISKITRKQSKTGKHGHEKRKSTREAKDSEPKPEKMVKPQSKKVNPSKE
ncbi:hypothetical protein Tco_1579321, partial [Tanacetum coccineum]